MNARSRAVCTRRGLVVLLADVDLFKLINDQHGHAVGDEVLMERSARLRNNVRSVDLAARWGGAEFCLILVDTNLDGARISVERLRRAICQRPFETSAGPLTVTLSLGVAGLQAGTESLAGLLQQADAALYAAKARGRDRFCLAEPPTAMECRATG